MPPAPANNPSDKALIDGCLRPDGDAREAFVRRFSRLVYSTIHGVINSKGLCICTRDMEDLHNTVFVSFFDRRCRKLRLFEGKNGCSLASWVRMITVRAVLDHLRRNKDPLAAPERLTPLELIPEPATGTSPWTCLAAKEQALLIQNGLERLSPRDRLVIQLHCLEERPLAQVAKILNISEGNIHSVKHRAVKRLKETVANLLIN